MTSTQKFSVLWSNNDTYTRPMSIQTLTLRKGLTCRHLHLDQVTVLFRPSADIGSTEFQMGDNADLPWRVETAQLMVRIRPGVEHLLYTANSDVPLNEVIIKQPTQSLTYSSSLSLVPNVEGLEDYWQRSYRPVRDCPVSNDLNATSQLEIQLLFPYLFTNISGPLTYTTVPDYRILKVYCEFSLDF